VSLDKHVSVLKFEIGYGVDIAHIGRVNKDPTSRKESFYVRVLNEHEW
jgi:phosphopantetheinyl transferase (holo-ACP synthase)